MVEPNNNFPNVFSMWWQLNFSYLQKLWIFDYKKWTKWIKLIYELFATNLSMASPTSVSTSLGIKKRWARESILLHDGDKK